MPKQKFVHLHVHTHYSLLDGLTKLDELIKAAIDDEAPAVAITDHGVMYGVIDFYKKCKKAGIKPIIGMEAYLAPASRHDKNTRDDEKKNYHLLLLAKNEIGYKNLIKLSTLSHLEGFYYKPRIDWELLKQYHEGLIGATACLAGEIPRLILANKIERAKKRILEYNELFGEGNFYLELQDHPKEPEQKKVNAELIKLSKELNVPLIATNDVHYLKKEDSEPQDILLCLQNKKKKDDADRMNMVDFDISYRPAKEMAESFKDVPEALENTLRIAEKCNLEIKLGETQMPYFEVPPGFDGNSYLKKLCEEGLTKRYNKDVGKTDEIVSTRLNYELSVIEKMGWPSYFLIVADFVNWAKSKNIVVGPGRGSAAGSLVCYLLGITNIDPLEYNLVFERFLNPDRISMPDIDLDFADTRRDEVIEYVENKYGKDHVAQIITFGTMAARAAVRDVGRVLDYPYEFCDRLAKTIPMFCKIDEALDTIGEVKELYRNEEGARKIIDFSRRLEGVARHASTHACGVVITKDPLSEYIPLQIASSSDRSIVTQYSLHPIEDLGILKIDFLGLKNLTIIESALKIIKNTRGLNIDIDKIPLDNKETYALFQKGETTGIFQFESSGMKRYLRELKPTTFEDLIAMVALYRPGPMEWIPDYIAGKHARKKLKYLHPKLEPILAKTYGVAIYQEQVLQIARDLAGFTMGQADILRKAVGKKIADLLAEQKEKFIEGCVRNGINSELAKQIFSFMEPFAGYGFNRSHAACYALIAYQTAYLKAHWPTEFMAALLTADQQNTDRIAVEIEECRRMGINVASPNINQSFKLFTVVTSGTEKNELIKEGEASNTIRFGLHAIKNIGENISEVLIRERKQNGPYKDISDLLERVTDKDLNKKSLESLIKCGALDEFGERGTLLGNIENMLKYNKEAAQAKNSNQQSLFANLPEVNIINKVKLEKYPPILKQEQLAWEKELLGLYVSEHPFSEFKKYLEDIVIPVINLKDCDWDKEVQLAGIITSIKKIITKSNEPMLFVKIEDLSGNVETLVFPSILKETAEIWEEGKGVFIKGKISTKDQEIKILINTASKLSSGNVHEVVKKFRKNGANNALRSVKTAKANLELKFLENLSSLDLEKLKSILKLYPGEIKVFFELPINGKNKKIETSFNVNPTPKLINELKQTLANKIIIKN